LKAQAEELDTCACEDRRRLGGVDVKLVNPFAIENQHAEQLTFSGIRDPKLKPAYNM
jgi:hypothetical protein